MDLIKCPECGEEYSASYPRCPFCEEENDKPGKIRYTPRRRIADKQKAQSARGGMIVVLVLVLALLGWYLFGDNLAGGNKAPNIADDEPAQGEAAVPASSANTDPFFEPDTSGEPEPQSEPAPEPEPEPEPEPAVDENVDVSGAKLNHDDVTLSYAGETFKLKLSGTEATPHWSIDNGNVVSVTPDADNASNVTVKALANGSTQIHCKVGTKDLTCTVRVRNTGKTAEAASEPTVIGTPAPAAPPAQNTTPPAQSSESKPAESTETKPAETKPASGSAQTISGTLRVKTNVTGELPKDKDTQTYDCTVRSGNPDSIRLIVYDDSGKEISVSWSSEDPDVARISDNGTITTISGGKTLMTAKVGEATIKCIIRVH